MVENYHHTSLLLQSLSDCLSKNCSFAGTATIAALRDALKEDGFFLTSLDATFTTRSLRGLAEASNGGGVDVPAVIAVIICIVCAGLASGLTQVNIFDHIAQPTCHHITTG
jgi:hypothetical protein